MPNLHHLHQHLYRNNQVMTTTTTMMMMMSGQPDREVLRSFETQSVTLTTANRTPRATSITSKTTTTTSKKTTTTAAAAATKTTTTAVWHTTNQTNKNQNSDNRNNSNYPTNFNHSSARFPECLTPWCIQQAAASLARAFAPRTLDDDHHHHHHHHWCILLRNRTNHTNHTNIDHPLRRGWQLVKTYKSASSTAAAVSVRITRHLGCDPSYTHWQHRSGRAFAHRLVNESFLLTSVRDPGPRALSSIFYHYVSFLPSQPQPQQHPTTTTAYLQHRLTSDTRDHPWAATSDGQGGYTLRYVSPNTIAPHTFWNRQQPRQVLQPELLKQKVRIVLQHYDFILVTGRMDESLVVLALLVGVPMDAVVVMNAKVAGQHYVHVRTRGGTLRCVPLVAPPAHITSQLQAMWEAPDYRAQNAGDLLLYEAARQSLDRTIDEVIGRERFDAALREYRHLQQLVHHQCHNQVHLPCSKDGVPQLEVSAAHCYIAGRDFGCGYPCVDAVVARAKQQQEQLEQQQQQQHQQQQQQQSRRHAGTGAKQENEGQRGGGG